MTAAEAVRPHRRDSRFGGLLLLASVSLYSPLTVVLVNLGEISRLFPLLGLVVSSLVVGIVVGRLLQLGGLDRRIGRYAGALLVFMFMFGGLLVGKFPRLYGATGVLVAWLAVVWVVHRLRHAELLDVLMFWCAVFLLLLPVGGWLRIQNALRSGSVESSSEGLRLGHFADRDVFLVVLDGYAGVLSLTERFGFDNAEIHDTLDEAGYRTPRSAWSNYSTTRVSVASLLDMSYPTTGGSLSVGDQSELFKIMGGRNQTMRAFSEAGYRVTYVESGWGGTTCGTFVEDCVGATFFDDALWSALDRSLVYPWMRLRWGSSFTGGALRAMDATLLRIEQLAGDDTPDFFFVHVLLPHPPLFLDSRCSLRVEVGYGGFALGEPDAPAVAGGTRASAFVEQVECVNGFLNEVVARLGTVRRHIVVLTADHGTDSRGQMQVEPDEWTDDQITERMNVFVAARLPEGCDLDDPFWIVNLMRRVVACLGSDAPDLPPRFFLTADVRDESGGMPVVAVSEARTRRLVESARGG